MAQATMTSKGQITIPKVIRDRLQLTAGEKVDFIVTDNLGVSKHLVARRQHDLQARFLTASSLGQVVGVGGV